MSQPRVILILAGLIVFAAHVVAGVTGFGSAILGLPLLALIVGLDAGKQSLLIVSSLLYAYLVIRWQKHIDWRQFFIMVAFASIGTPIGLFLYHVLPRRAAMMYWGYLSRWSGCGISCSSGRSMNFMTAVFRTGISFSFCT